MHKVAKIFSLLLLVAMTLGLASCTDPVDPVDPDDPKITEINALGSFADGGDAVYVLDINSTNALSVTFNKSTFAYANVFKDVTGDFTEIKALNITLQGSGVAVLVKLQNADGSIAREVQINANQTQQSISWDLSDETALLGAMSKIVIFAAPNQVNVTGSVLISEMKFTVAAAIGTIIESGHSDFVKPDPNMYTGQAGNFVVKNFYDGGDGVYEINEVGTTFEVDYTKPTGSNDWAFMRADLNGKFSDFARLVFEFTSTKDVDLLLKLEGTAGNTEVRITGTGVSQVVVIDLLALLPAQLDATDKIIIFGSPGTPGQGEITLTSVRFERALVGINKNWVSLDAGVYTTTENVDGSVDVTYNKGAMQAWSVLKLDIPVQYQMLNKLTITLSGVAGANFIIKPNDLGTLEQNITLAGTAAETFVFENPNGFTNIIFFAMPNVESVTGTFVIESVTLDFVPSEFDPTTTVSVNDSYVAADAGTYEFTYQDDGVVKVVYSIASYQFLRRNFDVGAVAGLNTLTVVLSGTAGKDVLIKPNDSGALETRVTFVDAEPVTMVFYADGFSTLLMFAEGGAASAFGTFFIHSVTLSYTYNAEPVSNANYIVTENEDVYDVAYTKAGDGYRFLNVTFDPLLTNGLNTLVVVLSGTIGESVLLKPNDLGSLEKMVNFTDANSVTTVITFDGFTQLIMFAQPGNADATGTFTIESISLSYVAPKPLDVDVTKVVDVNDGHISLDAGVYVFTDVTNGVKVDYTKVAGQAYSAILINFDAAEVEGLNTLYVKLSGGTPGAQVLLKPNDLGPLEKMLTFDANGVAEVTLHNTAYTKLVMFGAPGSDPANGSFVIEAIEVSYQVNLLAATWESLVPGVYTLTPNATGVSVAFAKNTGDEWAAIKGIVENTLGLNTLRVRITGGVSGQRVLIKPNDLGPLEQMLTFDANGTIEIDIAISTEITSMVVFISPNVAPTSGTVQIETFSLLFIPR